MRTVGVILQNFSYQFLGKIFTDKRVNIIGFSSFLAIFLSLSWRMTQGIDFSDESYYAIFLDGWLKEGINQSVFRSIHQTAALLVYPLAKFYHFVTGATDGLFLYLRYIYLLGSVLAASIWFLFVRPIFGVACAWGVAGCVLSFIPFGLPASSYNTLSMQFLLMALGAFGCGEMNESKAKWFWYIISLGFGLKSLS